MGKRTRLWFLVGVLVGSSVFAGTAFAVTPISQSYLTDGDLTEGSIVSLKKNSTDEVEAATTQNADNIFGVVINSDNSLLTISSKDGAQVQIANEGTMSVLVSDINGPIQRGDHITASPIAGIGMKATDNIRIVGIAQGDMVGQKKQTIDDGKGAKEEVTLGEIPVLINVAYYFKQPEKTLVPGAIQSIANGLAGKKVDTLPILVSAGIFFVMLVIISSIIYSMIRSSIISVGRNPMSQSAIYRDLIQMSVLVLAILTVGVISIYMVLTRL